MAKKYVINEMTKKDPRKEVRTREFFARAPIGISEAEKVYCSATEPTFVGKLRLRLITNPIL